MYNIISNRASEIQALSRSTFYDLLIAMCWDIYTSVQQNEACAPDVLSGLHVQIDFEQ